MIENSKNFNLYKLILHSLTLDNFEYFYLYPLLEQTGLYAGHSGAIFIAQKLSQQTKNSFHCKILFQNSLQNSHECIRKEDHIPLCLQFQVCYLEIHFHVFENVLIEYRQQHLFFEIYIFYVYSSFSFGKPFYEVLKPTINNMLIELSKKHSWKENLFHCIQYIVIYKIWKIEYWYSIISKLAFDCKEIRMAKYYIQMTKLEYNMIFVLVNLFKYEL